MAKYAKNTTKNGKNAIYDRVKSHCGFLKKRVKSTKKIWV